jgi:hypothetical protein
MKTILRPQKIILSCLLMSVCFSCARQASDVDVLFNTVDCIIDQQPNSALPLLYTVLFPENLKENRYNKFMLLLIQAKDKSYKDITSDIIIFKVKDYYVQNYKNEIVSLLTIGDCYLFGNKINSAFRLISTYSLLSKIEEDLGDYKNSLLYLKEYSSYVKKMVDNNENKALLELQKKYDFEKQKSDNDNRMIKQQKITITFFIAFIITFIIASFFCIKFFQSEKLRLEAERKIENVKKMAKNHSEKDESVRNILLHQFNILKKVALIETTIREEDRNNGRKLIRKFNKIVYEQDSIDWGKFYEIINNLHDGIYDKVHEMYPQLNDIEFRLCYLSGRNNLSDNEISVIMKITTTNKVRKMRSDIRKKIEVPAYQNIHNFFAEKFSKE